VTFPPPPFPRPACRTGRGGAWEWGRSGRCRSCRERERIPSLLSVGVRGEAGRGFEGVGRGLGGWEGAFSGGSGGEGLGRMRAAEKREEERENSKPESNVERLLLVGEERAAASASAGAASSQAGVSASSMAIYRSFKVVTGQKIQF